jgi:uridine phosphorylase
MKTDFLYHLGLSTETHDFPALFGDVKFVCCGGSMRRMEKLARFFVQELGIVLPYGTDLVNLCNSDRYVMYKVGPVLCVNHGIGVPSMSVMLHEVFKLLDHAECAKNVVFFRLGTSGGIGYDAGTVIVATGAVNGLLEPVHESFVLGRRMKYPSLLDEKLSNEIYELANLVDFPVQLGKTMCADDFYEGQGRLDGAMCNYTEVDKFNFLRQAYEKGVRNIEMESSAFASYTCRAGFKAAIICTTVVNRLETDQIIATYETLKTWEERPCLLVALYIKHQLNKIEKFEQNGQNDKIQEIRFH